MQTEKQNALDVRELWNTARRRRRLMVAVFAGVLTLFVALALFLPPTYESSGTILIEQQDVPNDLVRSTVSGYADQRIQMVRQQVMTTENLLPLIERHGLYQAERRTRPREVLLERMRDAITFRTIAADVIDPRSGSPTKATIAFSLGFQSDSPAVANRVAGDLISLFLSQNIARRQQIAADTTEFLDDEARRLDATITKLEADIASFKEQNMNELPERAQLNVQLVQRAESELRELNTRIRTLGQQTVYLEAQLAQTSPNAGAYSPTGQRILSTSERLKYLHAEYARASALYADTHPDVLRLRREIASLEGTAAPSGEAGELWNELVAARAELEQSRDRYSNDHPDVVRFERLVESLERRIAALPETAPAVLPSVEPDNPAYIELRAQLDAARNEREALREERSALQTQLEDLQASVARAPMIERDYEALLRELGNAQLRYGQVRQKQMEAQLSQNLEEERKAERFTLIEPPIAPSLPSSPNRVLVLVLGLALAIAGAVGAAFLREVTDATVRGRKDLAELLGVPPLAVIPRMLTKNDLAVAARRRKYVVAAAIGAVVFAAILVHVLYRPVDVLWYAGLRRFGL